MTTRTYVLDTSVLLAHPNAFTQFHEHTVVLPIVVITELESKRNDPILGYNARTALRHLEKYRTTGGDLRHGVTVNDNNGQLRVEVNHVDLSNLPATIRATNSHDARILSVADALKTEGQDVRLVSNDLPMRLLAHSVLGLPAEEYLAGQHATDTLYTGIVETYTDTDTINELFNGTPVRLPDLPLDTPTNTGVIMTTGQSTSALGRVTTSGAIELVRGDTEAFGLHGRSAEQRIALTHLLNPNIGVVSLGGPAGTGKSVLALAAALEHVVEHRTAKRIIVFRPLLAVGGQDLGFLPGTEEEKMNPWTAAVTDAMRAITNETTITELTARNTIEVLPLTHIRGRTLTDTIVILDECQNLEVSTILTAITRLGEGSRIFLLHDLAQRDNLRVGRYDGIASVIERLKGEPLFAHVTLTKSERSPVAALAARLLDDRLT